jgi:DNA-binding XRE family transcriptional regulator
VPRWSRESERKINARAEAHEAIARLVVRDQSLLADARRAVKRTAAQPSTHLPAPWQEVEAEEVADARWAQIVSFDPDDVAAWIRAFGTDGWMNLRSPFRLDSDAVRRELTVIRRHLARSPHENTKLESKLARLRTERGISQAEMVRRTGLHESTYWRLERKRMENPPIGYLAACARALDVPIDDLIEDEWLKWTPRDQA